MKKQTANLLVVDLKLTFKSKFKKKKERTSLIQSYDYTGKCLFHLHQTVIPKYIIIVMKQEGHDGPGTLSLEEYRNIDITFSSNQSL